MCRALNDPGAGGIVSIVLLSAALAGGLWAVRRLRGRPGPETRPPPSAPSPSPGRCCSGSINPFLALLAVPAVHAWPVDRRPAPADRALGVLALAVGLLPAVARPSAHRRRARRRRPRALAPAVAGQRQAPRLHDDALSLPARRVSRRRLWMAFFDQKAGLVWTHMRPAGVDDHPPRVDNGTR